MFEFQDRYYHSDFYQNEIRMFKENDTLGLRFKELEEQFGSYQKIWRD